MASVSSCCDTEGVLQPVEITSTIKPPEQKCNIKLCSGEKITDYTEAGKRLLERDFNKFIDLENQKQTEIIVSPPEFIHKRPDLPHRGTKEHKQICKEFPDLQINLESEDFEADVFYSIKKFFQEKSLSKEIAIIQGWKEIYSGLTETSKKKGAPGDEYDLIIIDGCRKFILLIEAKQTLGYDTLQKALQQTGSQIQYFKKFHGYFLDQEWRAFPVIVCQKLRPEICLCSDCSTYVLTPEELTIDKFGTWWNELGNQVKQCTPLTTDAQAYLTLLGRVIGLSLQCDLFIGSTDRYLDWSKQSLTGSKEVVTASHPPDSTFRIEKKKTYPDVLDPSGEKRILYFLSGSQKMVLTNDKMKRVILRGNYGTGKSLLLKIKAIQLAKRGEKVVFVLDGDCKIFYKLTKADFDKVYEKDKVKCKIEVVTGNWKDVWTYANNGYHVFSDEMLGKDRGSYKDNSDCLNLEKIKPDTGLDVYIWLAMAYNRSVLDRSAVVEGLEEFQVVDLKINFRNSREIYRMLEQLDPDESSGVEPCRENLLKPNLIITDRRGLNDAIIKALNGANSLKIGLLVHETVLSQGFGLLKNISKKVSENGWKVIEVPKELPKLSPNDEFSKVCFLLGNNEGTTEWYGIEVTNIVIVYRMDGIDDSIVHSSLFEDFLEFHRKKVAPLQYLENLISRAVVSFTMVIQNCKDGFSSKHKN